MQIEAEERILHGKIISGSGLGQSYSTQPLTNAEFFVIFNEWSGAMIGVSSDSGGFSQTRPNFAGRGYVSPLQYP